MKKVAHSDEQDQNVPHLRLVHMRYGFGHRQAYQDLLADLFSLAPSTGRIGPANVWSLFRAKALLFGTLDDDYAGFFLIALLRALVGRRTVGLLLRPQTCFSSSALRFRAKKLAFVLLKKVRLVSVFTIVPFSVAPEYVALADGGLVDPQLWDMDKTVPCVKDVALLRQIDAASSGRKVLAFIGTVHTIKGVTLLRNMMLDQDWPSKNVLVVVAGRFTDETEELAGEFESLGAMVVARYISGAELRTIYERADFVWACYRPDYDQASGIFGRAVQTGRIPVVRADSLISRFARQYCVSVEELEWSALGSAKKLSVAIEQASKGNPNGMKITETIATWKSEFITTIERVL